MKTLLLGLIAALFIFTGCKKCDDSYNNLEGNWYRTTYYGNNSWGAPFEWYNGNDGTQIRFTNNGDYYRGEAKSALAFAGTYKVRGNTIEVNAISVDGSEVTESFTYSLQNGELHLKYYRTESVQEEIFRRR